MAEGLSFRELLDSAPDGLIVSDGAGAIVWANETAAKLFDYPAAQLAGKNLEELIPERLRQAHEGHRADYMASPRVRPMGIGLNLVARRSDGSEFPVEISLSPLVSGGRPLVTAVVRDVTERRRLEEERSLLSKELERERERDRIAMDLHDGIMQDVYAAILALELALPEDPAAAYADAEDVKKAIGQLQGVVRDIRSYIFDLRPREFRGRLPEALAELANEFSQNSQINTRVDIDEEIAVALPDAVALYYIAHESLSNIQRHARAENVTVSLSAREGMGHLVIRDDGVGFDTMARPSEQHRGLHNLAARASSIGGKLTIESAPGRGAEIRVDFPLRRP
jgi:protein-histidine pros-kinase